MAEPRKTKKKKHSRNLQNPARNVPFAFGYSLLLYLLFTVLVVLFVYLCIRVRFIQDDTYITLRYVRNFVDGKGLVFNPGERVEGYTCFLWVMLLSVAALVHNNIEAAAQYGSLFFGVLTLFAVYSLSRIVLKGEKSPIFGDIMETWLIRYLALLPVLMLVLTNAFTLWTISGMETALFTFLVVSGQYWYMKSRRHKRTCYLAVLLLLLGSLTRPEGLMVFALVMIHRLYFAYNVGSSQRHLAFRNIVTREIATELAFFIIPYAVYVGFRLYYYGYPLPNTFYAKTGFSIVYLKMGIEYFLSFSRAYLLYGVIAAAPLSLLLMQKSNRYRISLLVLITGMYVLYVIVIGGDVLLMHRFFLPVLPLIYILWVAFLKQILTVTTRLVKGTVCVLSLVGIVVGGLAVPFINYTMNIAQTEFVRSQEYSLVARMKDQAFWLKKQEEKRNENLSVACTTIGSLAYFSGVPVIDMLGLTDAYISHHPKEITEISDDVSVSWKERNYNADYILERKPDYIIFSTNIKPSAFAERALFSKRAFFKNYYVQLVSSELFSVSHIIYTKKTPEQLASTKTYEPNPSYDISFVGNYVRALSLLPPIGKTIDSGKADQIQDLCETIIKTCPPEFSDAYRILGEIFFSKKKNKEAVKCLLKAVEIDEFNCLVNFYLYDLYTVIGEKEPAEYYAKKLRKYAPDLKIKSL
ncbi:tetratricopeptide repeat protein [Candidatus Latescibacterota bacterium]